MSSNSNFNKRDNKRRDNDFKPSGKPQDRGEGLKPKKIKKMSKQDFTKTKNSKNLSPRNHSDAIKPFRLGSGEPAKGIKQAKPARQKHNQKTMDIDLSILVKKAKPQSIADYTPSSSFADHGLDAHLVSNLEAKGYVQPTQIQDKSIPYILKKQDLIGIANTGTGKTAAFLLPLIHQVYNDPSMCVLVLAPTRELVMQIHKELKSFVNNSAVSSAVIIGGVNIEAQKNELRKKKNFIISTTGRGLDLIGSGSLRMKEVDTIVLDEMDQMLDMGFVNDIKKILSLATKLNHLLLFSATSTPSIEKIAMELLNNPARVRVDNGQTTDNVEQSVIELKDSESKMDRLCQLLDQEKMEKVIIFENTKHGSNKIEKELIKRGYSAIAIHGNKNQNQRTRALDAFKKNEIRILIATNVAARGLDIPQVSHVINYGLPQSKEDYIHRIGRTGRAGEVGKAYTFITYEQNLKK